MSYGLQYQHAITRRCHVVATRAGKVPGEYRSALRKADRDFNGTPRGTVGPAEALLATFRLVPLVVGHFAEGSEGLLDLIGRTARALCTWSPSRATVLRSRASGASRAAARAARCWRNRSTRADDRTVCTVPYRTCGRMCVK